MSQPEPARVPPIIRAKLGFTRLSNPDLEVRLEAIVKGMKGNEKLSSSPIDIPKFEQAVQSFSSICTAALDGGRRAISERDVQRRDIILMAQEIGHYVEHNCDGNMETFLSSGFEPRSTTRTPASPLEQPKIAKVRHGHSGELLVSATPVKGAYSYEIRYAATDANRAPGELTTIAVGSARAAVSIDGLTPGIVYVFQVHALGKLGYTDWSDPVCFMCT
jgi:hypothetical protein